MARPKKRRLLHYKPNTLYFKPRGVPLRLLKETQLRSDEIEALQLKYIENLNQQKGASKMRISQSTFGRILLSASKKIAQAILEGKAIRIEKLKLKR